MQNAQYSFGNILMKILFSGYHNPHFYTITEYVERAIIKLGHKLIIFDDRQHIIPARIRKKISWLQRFDLHNINRKLVSSALSLKPDMLIVTGGHRITGRTVKILKDNGIVRFSGRSTPLEIFNL